MLISPLTIRVSLPAPPSIVAPARPLSFTLVIVITSLLAPRLILALAMLPPLTVRSSSPVPRLIVPVMLALAPLTISSSLPAPRSTFVTEPLPFTIRVSLPAPVLIVSTVTVVSAPLIVILSLPTPLPTYSFRLAFTVILAVASALPPVFTSR